MQVKAAMRHNYTPTKWLISVFQYSKRATRTYIADGSEEWYNPLESSWLFSCKVENKHIPWPSSFFPGYILQKNECTCAPGYNNVHDIIAHNSPKLEATQKVICNKMDK